MSKKAAALIKMFTTKYLLTFMTNVIRNPVTRSSSCTSSPEINLPIDINYMAGTGSSELLLSTQLTGILAVIIGLSP